MDCLECQELLQRRLDGEPIAGAMLEQHLSQCATCRDQHAAALRLLEGLRVVLRPTPVPGFAAAIAANVIRDRRERRAKLGRRVLVTLALAASVLGILFMAYFWMPPLGINKKNIVEVPPKKIVPSPKPEVKPEEEPELRGPLSPMMDRWADATRDHARVVLVATNLDGVGNLPVVNNLPAIDPGVREASQEVSDGVRTVTRNARRAFEFFTRELPMPDMGEQKN
jgi:hypothetical protein